MENHSYDNFFGLLGRARGQQPRGDGFVLGAGGQPTASNPYPDGRVQHAFPMPTTCQLSGGPTQEWTACHTAYDNGSNDGFVAASGPVAMGYWTGDDLPFTYDLATTFPVGDRWFCSVLGQTDPNRRYLIAATSAGMTDDIGVGVGDLIPDLSLPLPGSGTIFDVLDAHQIPWANYSASFPLGATPELYPVDDTVSELAHMKPFDQFFADAAAGTLAPFTLLDPDYDTQSQENPQNIVVGEALLAQVVHAIGASPSVAGHPPRRHVRRARRLLRPRPSAAGAWRPTSSLRWCNRASRPTRGSVATASGCPRSWCRPTPNATTSATCCTTTPRCWPWWSASGTCRRSPTGTPTPTT